MLEIVLFDQPRLLTTLSKMLFRLRMHKLNLGKDHWVTNGQASAYYGISLGMGSGIIYNL